MQFVLMLLQVSEGAEVDHAAERGAEKARGVSLKAYLLGCVGFLYMFVLVLNLIGRCDFQLIERIQRGFSGRKYASNMHRPNEIGRIRMAKGTDMRSKILGLLAVALVVGPMAAQANLVVNGDFETGDLSGWTTYITANGGLGIGFPIVESFDTTGSGASDAAKFKVGQIVFSAGVPAGGGIYQDFSFGGGGIAISLDISSQAQPDSDNGTGGLFELFVDGVQLDSFDFGYIFGGTTERDSLSYSGALAAGVHELRVQMTRLARVGPTPYQYLDNISVATVPEPGTLALLGLGLVGMRGMRRRND